MHSKQIFFPVTGPYLERPSPPPTAPKVDVLEQARFGRQIDVSWLPYYEFNDPRRLKIPRKSDEH